MNGKLVKHVRSPTLKENDIISLDLDDTHSYIFVIENVNDDISDEQLCIIADSVLNDMEFLTSSSEEVDGNEALGGKR